LHFDEVMIPRTHDLEELQLLCAEFVHSNQFRVLELEELSDYAVSVRYDFEFWPDAVTAREAVDLAEIVRTIVVNTLPLEV